MLYGIQAGFGSPQVPVAELLARPVPTLLSPQKPRSSNFLQVPDVESPRFVSCELLLSRRKGSRIVFLVFKSPVYIEVARGKQRESLSTLFEFTIFTTCINPFLTDDETIYFCNFLSFFFFLFFVPDATDNACFTWNICWR